MKHQFRVWRKETAHALYKPSGDHNTLDAAAAAAGFGVYEQYPSGNYGSPLHPLVFVGPVQIPETVEERVSLALDLIAEYGWIDGAHHKQWALDQVARTLAGDGYEAWASEIDGAWDVGVAP